MTTGPESPLPPGRCMALLRSVPTGRLVYTDGALPAVHPVTFAAPNGEIVVPTGDDGWFERFDGGLLAFHAEQLEEAVRTGWSVVAIGRARLVRGTDGLLGFDGDHGVPWGIGPTDPLLVI
ncbi:MAG: pyridoxamine 5'-phosphate oxidase family protein, partial [Rhodococcus sp. (in: high G+C Gram-positive bacteria)]|nr:pyridoxamine 5'-phosphate oxidase family protein [Rhodococcus sp. (in: high G+C Gram-positive bacteria)]MDX5455906.1 pyridoxamine 5'-phosphate oxidase family protein [Rhodococcus sp. (in: high G+C Gram-positive bacteria)]